MLRRRSHDGFARHRRAGEGNHVDAWILREECADGRVGGRDHVEDTRGDVGVLGDESTERQCAPWGLWCRLQHDRASGGERRCGLGEVDLCGHVPRGNRRHDPDRFAFGPTFGRPADRVGDAERCRPFERLGEVGVVGEELQWLAEVSHVARRLRCADFGHRDLGHLRHVIAKRSIELPESAHAQRNIVSPAALVERTAGGNEGSFDVTRRRIGCDTDLLAGRRVDVGVGRASLGGDELTIDRQAGLRPAHALAPTRVPGVNLMGRLVQPVTLEE